MIQLIPSFSVSDYLSLFSIICTTLIGIVAVFYGRKTYFVSLKSFNENKNLYEAASFYIREFISVSPNKTIDPFLKKIASDQLNGGIEIPSFLTDILIRKYADYYFYLVKSLRTTWKFFKVENGEIQCIYSERELVFKGLAYGALYTVTGSLAFFIFSNYTWFLARYTSDSALNIGMTLIILLVFLLFVALGSLVMIFKLITVRDINQSLNLLKQSENNRS